MEAFCHSYDLDPGCDLDPGRDLDPGCTLDPGCALDPGRALDPGHDLDLPLAVKSSPCWVMPVSCPVAASVVHSETYWEVQRT